MNDDDDVLDCLKRVFGYLVEDKQSAVSSFFFNIYISECPGCYFQITESGWGGHQAPKMIK